VAGLKLHLRRRYGLIIVKSYLPSLTLVIIFGISFFIPAEIVPGRMTLLITIFLVLVNLTSVFNSSFSQCLTAMDIWLRVCMAFVAIAIMEYAFILYKSYHADVKVKNGKKRKQLARDVAEECKGLDRKFAIIFYGILCLFNVIYWVTYLS